jgi:hypothetical protein
LGDPLVRPLKKNLIERPSGDFHILDNPNTRNIAMKITTIVLALAVTLPTTSAFAEAPINWESHVALPVRSATVGQTGRIATTPRNISGNTLAPIANDPSGSTLTPSAVNRGG